MTATGTPARRLLLVHAHPDDESLITGATMAHYAAAGAGVTLVTCTRGEEGEIVVAELAHLAADREDGLGPWRVGELAAACEALGVSDHRFLGGAGRWRDSGMMGAASNDRPDCFWQADATEASEALVAVVREVRPQVAVTYAPDGGYGHPDHIQAHRVTVAALAAAADPARRRDLGPPWSVARLFYAVVPVSLSEAGAAGPFAVADTAITAEVRARRWLPAKLAALQAHRSQVAPDGWLLALATSVAGPHLGSEFYQLSGAAGPAQGPWTDLFAGL